MTKPIAELARHPARVAVVLAVVLTAAFIGLLIARLDTGAVHNAGLIELDIHTATGSECGTPKEPGKATPTPFPSCGDANTKPGATSGDGAFDWQDVCTTSPSDVLGDHFAGDITEDTSPPVPMTQSCDADYYKADHTYFSSDKDIQDICGVERPCANTAANFDDVTGSHTWECVELSNPLDKDEILNGYAAQAVAPAGGATTADDGDTILYYGFERESHNGTSFQGFWFLQNGGACSHSGSGTTPFSGGPHQQRCGLGPDGVAGTGDDTSPGTVNGAACPGGSNPGDILILVNYTGGGRIASVDVGTWDPGQDDCSVAQKVAGTPICRIFTGQDCSALGTLDDACAVVNGLTALTPPNPPWNTSCVPRVPCDPAVSGGDGAPAGVSTNQFFEGGIDLNQVLCPSSPDTCTIPCFSDFIAETRSSAEFSATLKDFVHGAFNTCSAAIEVAKTDEAGNLLKGACFEFTPEPDAVTSPVCDGDSQDKDPADGKICVDGVAVGSYSIHESRAPGGYSLDTVDKTVSIVGPLRTTETCPKTDADKTFVDPLGDLTIKKTDKAGNLLTGATFKITPNPFYCTSGTPGGTPSPGPNPGTGSYTATDGGTNDPDGTADGDVTFTGTICIGSYTIEETIAPSGYSLDPTNPRYCDVTEANGQECTVSGAGSPGVTFVDPLGKLRIEKIDRNTGELVGGATFEITPNVFGCHQPPGTDPSPITDGGATDPDGTADGIIELTGVCIPSTAGHLYTVTETAPPPGGYLIDPDTKTQTCEVSEDTTPKQDCGTLTFKDFRGSIIIRKEAKDARTPCVADGPGCHDLLGGATFQITPDPTDGTHTCAGGTIPNCLEVKDDSPPDQFNATPGLICIDNVSAVPGSFSVKESAAPANYAKDTTNPRPATAVGDTCANRTTSGTPDVTFVNTPLSTIEVIFQSLAGPGITTGVIECTDEAGVVLTFTSGGSPDVDQLYGDGTTTLVPNNALDPTKHYTCTIRIDP